ncbi:hypothetical protein N7E81_01520 [Reichenbachiella carrageenanivorans]|uniref:Uncharacterized protein n=1 Tax=Reichenbachiella carrageenanivorans TaxID=2979869 RepID=A0ABY6D0T7_9BACT|nr:hypothetical protein [Reichenbachiella carrageenanivorans]UXX79786.1 hypothetical protein N7E81_01520 [Reichenbachiella carrageenanivorans]
MNRSTTKYKSRIPTAKIINSITWKLAILTVAEIFLNILVFLWVN